MRSFRNGRHDWQSRAAHVEGQAAIPNSQTPNSALERSCRPTPQIYGVGMLADMSFASRPVRGPSRTVNMASLRSLKLGLSRRGELALIAENQLLGPVQK